jgi:PilZ domain
MTNVLTRLGSISDAMRPDRRRAPRSIVRAEVNMTASNGTEIKATIADISTHGCNLRSDCDAIKIGGFVAISLESGHPLQAIVRWLREGSVGVEFLRPIPANYNEWHELIDSWQGS